MTLNGGRGSIDIPDKPRVVTFGDPSNDSVSTTSLKPQEGAPLTANRASITQEASPGSLPRKSRFVVDNPHGTISSQRTDSTHSQSNSDTQAQNTVSSTSQTAPAEVKKGRFSVIDGPGSTSSQSNLQNPPTGTLSTSGSQSQLLPPPAMSMVASPAGTSTPLTAKELTEEPMQASEASNSSRLTFSYSS
jgi:hypothetical protein